MAPRFIPITSAPVRTATRFAWFTWAAAFLPLFFGGWYYALRSADMGSTGAWWPHGMLSFVLAGVYTLTLAALPILIYLYRRAWPQAHPLLMLVLIVYIALAIVQIVNWALAMTGAGDAAADGGEAKVGQLIAPLLWGGLGVWTVLKLQHPECRAWATEVASWVHRDADVATFGDAASGPGPTDLDDDGATGRSPDRGAP